MTKTSNINELKKSHKIFVDDTAEIAKKLKFVYKDEREKQRDKILYDSINSIFQYLTGGDIVDPRPPTLKKLDIKIVDASKDDGNIPKNVIDGKVDTRFSSQGQDAFITAEISKPDKALIKGLGLAFYKGDERTQSFGVHASIDNKNWFNVLNAAGSGTTKGVEQYELANIKPGTKFIKITNGGNSQGNPWFSISELEILGDDSEGSGGGGGGSGPDKPDKPDKPTEPGDGKGSEVEGVKIPYETTGNSRTKYHHNVNNGLRLDYENNPKDGAIANEANNFIPKEGTYLNSASIIYMEFTGKVPDDNITDKYSVMGHSNSNKVKCLMASIENSDGEGRIRYEETHNKYKSVASYKTNAGQLKKNQVFGDMGIRLTLPDGSILFQKFRDYGGLDKDGNPANQWQLMFSHIEKDILVNDFTSNGMEETKRIDGDDKTIKIHKNVLVELKPLDKSVLEKISQLQSKALPKPQGESGDKLIEDINC